MRSPDQYIGIYDNYVLEVEAGLRSPALNEHSREYLKEDQSGIEMAKNFDYEHFPHAYEGHAIGIVKGLVEGKELVLVGHYWYGNNLTNSIDEIAGEFDGSPLDNEEAHDWWDMLEFPLSLRFQQDKGVKVLRSELR